MVMLKRRNVPLYSKGGFDFIYYDGDDKASKCVVGVTSEIGATDKTKFCRGIVLVNRDGIIASSKDQQKEVRVSVSLKKDKDSNVTKKEKELNESRQAMKRNIDSAREAFRSRGHGGTGTGTGTGGSANIDPSSLNLNLSEEQTSELAKLGLMLIGILTILRIIASVFFTGYVLLVPLGIMYAMSNCPTEDSFDAKRELKRVLRG